MLATSGWHGRGPFPARPDLMHRVGGLEKQDVTGNVNYEAANHQHMVNTRAAKVAGIAADIPPTVIEGAQSGAMLVLSWGGTYGSCATAVRELNVRGRKVGHVHLRYFNPLPSDLGDILTRFEDVIIPELNLGQLRMMIRAQYLVDAIGLNKVQGKPFIVAEIVQAIESLLSTNGHSHPHNQTIEVAAPTIPVAVGGEG